MPASSQPSRDFTILLWLLKLGALPNLYFLARTLLVAHSLDVRVTIPAIILFAVSAYRCLFPVRYEGDIVFHRSVFSSIFVTRVLATFCEVTYIYLFSHVLRMLNVDRVGWIDLLSWYMVVQVIIAQGFVWAAILTERFIFYFYEELGWELMFVGHTACGAYLYAFGTADGGRRTLLQIILVFGAIYLPWQVLNLRALYAQAKAQVAEGSAQALLSERLKRGLERSIRQKNQRSDAQSWGGFVGLTWMLGYWATLIPIWGYFIVVVLADH